jgi:hypothetical protein
MLPFVTVALLFVLWVGSAEGHEATLKGWLYRRMA